MAPYRAILRYYRCDTPYRAILFKGSYHSPKMVRYPPPLVLSFAHAHLCDTPFCYVSRDNCAIPPLKQARKSFAILSLQISRDMKSIVAGPLSQQTKPPEKFTLEKFTSQNSPSKFQPRNRAKKFTLHLCRAIWLSIRSLPKEFLNKSSLLCTQNTGF